VERACVEVERGRSFRTQREQAYQQRLVFVSARHCDDWMARGVVILSSRGGVTSIRDVIQISQISQFVNYARPSHDIL
jgi:hypothetical protein